MKIDKLCLAEPRGNLSPQCAQRPHISEPEFVHRPRTLRRLEEEACASSSPSPPLDPTPHTLPLLSALITLPYVLFFARSPTLQLFFPPTPSYHLERSITIQSPVPTSSHSPTTNRGLPEGPTFAMAK
ncbi:hypothetical protein FA13DRAFT_5814 [Coprinellus micaceus]|uniref:Uncharacterized protein n=1 Tax=Coprinellus micaceus TaxID=71717 RepID=A0A4Y7TZA9_COPMI|nr:hypothetical protein FA13DRAFT_5814 [Coprinellus micaceus]